ncbi:unnamed protein product [Clonostachys rosea f. rosea IK726]|uniref:Uncharacterized protein n=1 Tax=Clonostachys rosea f. rosea IK726 TaxID=1349383 RepID=A0ACA9UKE5_BIOOC|nr:unnamed protein product [Clonostachys rosea f. rosea IK726]
MSPQPSAITSHDNQKHDGGIVEKGGTGPEMTKSEPEQTVSAQPPGTTDTEEDADCFLEGWRLWVVTAGM